MSRRQALKISAASLATLGAAQQSARADEPLLADARGATPVNIRIDAGGIHREIKRLLESSGLPGLSLAVIEDGQLVDVHGFGYANPRTKQPVVETTIFQAASLTKPTFAYVVLRLCEEGLLNLDAPLTAKYLPEVDPSTNPWSARITARMVLAHMSGLPITHFPKWPELMDFEPGERFGYSGAAYIYLQQVVEKLLSMPLLDIMDKYVVQPLGWTDSAYAWRADYETEAAIAHDFDNTPIREAERSRPKQACSAASLHTTPKDFAAFLIEFLFKRNGVLPLDYMLKGMMTSPQIRLTNRLAWGLGWGLRLADDGDRFWHWGDSRGYMSYAVGSLAHRRGVVIFTNGRNGLRVAEQVAAKVMGRDESETFDWIYNGFYAQTGAPVPPLPSGERSTPPGEIVETHKSRRSNPKK